MRKATPILFCNLPIRVVYDLTAFNLKHYSQPGPIEFALADFIANSSVLKKDLQKIDADWENTLFTEDKIIAHTTPNGVQYVSAYHCGDWELPVYFILYVDHTNTLRGYVPKDGNTYDTCTKAAYGNEDAEDSQVARWASYGYDPDEFDIEALALYDNRREFNKVLFEAGIDRRIQTQTI